MEEKTPRLVVFDFLRILLILLVINVHIRILSFTFVNVLTPFEYMAVPLFLLVSLYLTGKYFIQQTLSFQKLFVRTKRLGIPLLFWSLIGFTVHFALFTPQNIVLQFLTGEVVNVPLYYLVLVIWFSILFWLLSHFPGVFRWSILFLLLIGCFFVQYSNANYFFFVHFPSAISDSYGRFVELLPYAIAGLFFAAMRKYVMPLALLIATEIFFMASWSMPAVLPHGFHYQGLALFLQSLSVFSVVIFLSPVSFPQKIARSIHLLGKYSFGVYLFHFPILEMLVGYFPSLKFFMYAHSLVFLFIYAIFCYSVVFFLLRLTGKKFAYLLQ